MSELKQKILELRTKGYTYNKIVDELGCSKATVCYYCGENQHNKNLLRQRKNRAKQHPFTRKIEHFCELKTIKPKKEQQQKTKLQNILNKRIKNFSSIKGTKTKMKYTTPSFTTEELLNKIGDQPKCYLTGQPIDLNKPSTYQFDHIIPRSRGGSNDLDNLGLCTKEANLAKRDMTPEEFINLCKMVVDHKIGDKGIEPTDFLPSV